MSGNEHDFRKLIGGLRTNDEPNPAHRERLRRQMLETFEQAGVRTALGVGRPASRDAERRTQFYPELTQLRKVEAGDMPQDDLFDEAVRVVLETKRGSVSLLQRRLSIGYARASRIIEMMAGAGILGDYKGSQAREVLLTVEEYEQLRAQMNAGTQMTLPGMEEKSQADSESEMPTYATEGQEGYLATEPEEEEEEVEP